MPSLRNSVRAFSPVATVAVAGGLCGLAGLISSLPSGLRLALVLAFIAAGPGCAVLSRFPAVGSHVIAALSPIIGLSVVTIVTGLTATWHAMNSSVILAVSAVLTLLLAVVKPSWRATAATTENEPSLVGPA